MVAISIDADFISINELYDAQRSNLINYVEQTFILYWGLKVVGDNNE